jgi:ligand-binding SRPBCC domain-containing protein
MGHSYRRVRIAVSLHRLADARSLHVWRHTHVFEAVSKDATLIHDLVEYRMPLGPLGEIAHKLFVARIVQRFFDFRATEIRRLLGESARG